jgi:hypothetical protein
LFDISPVVSRQCDGFQIVPRTPISLKADRIPKNPRGLKWIGFELDVEPIVVETTGAD